MLTVPLPVPLAPPAIVIHAVLDTAAHVHWLAVVTVTEPEPPDGPNDSDAAETVNVHGGGVGSVGELLSQPASTANRRRRARPTART